VASEFARDANLDANDAFEVVLDTFRDRHNAFYFQTNAVGARRDALIRNEGEAINWDWDGIWTVACAARRPSHLRVLDARLPPRPRAVQRR